MMLNKFNDKHLALLESLDIIVDRERDYPSDELEEILDTLTMRINADRDVEICEDIITIITTDKDW